MGFHAQKMPAPHICNCIIFIINLTFIMELQKRIIIILIITKSDVFLRVLCVEFLCYLCLFICNMIFGQGASKSFCQNMLNK